MMIISSIHYLLRLLVMMEVLKTEWRTAAARKRRGTEANSFEECRLRTEYSYKLPHATGTRQSAGPGLTSKYLFIISVMSYAARDRETAEVWYMFASQGKSHKTPPM
jgi:hypothetical protein